MFVSFWKKRNIVFTEGVHLVRELNWRWVLVSEPGQKNVNGPKDSWDVTPTLWGWFQLLCMSKTNHYICFYFVFCLRIEKREKIVASVINNCIGFILLDFSDWHWGVISWNRHNRGEEEVQLGWTQTCRERVLKGEKHYQFVWPCTCAHTHAST